MEESGGDHGVFGDGLENWDENDAADSYDDIEWDKQD